METLGFYLLVISISLTGVMSPGPLTAVTLARGRRNALAGLWINAGHALAEVPLILALLAGLGPFLSAPGLFRIVSLLGGLVLLAMGGALLRRKETAAPDLAETPERGAVMAGAAMTAFNPYWFVWWLTVGLGLLTRAEAIEMRFAVPAMVAVHLACDFAWGTFLSWAAHRGGGAFRPGTWRRIEQGCGGALVLFGGLFLYGGIAGS